MNYYYISFDFRTEILMSRSSNTGKALDQSLDLHDAN